MASNTFKDNDGEEEFSVSFGSIQDEYLLLDSDNASDITPPPLANPPSDASYSSSFLEMVRQSVQRAQTLYNLEPDFQEEQGDESDSFESILHFGSSQDNQEKSFYTGASEELVEKGRRLEEQEQEFAPFGLESQQSQDSIPEFAIIREDPLSVNHIRYTTNKRKKKEQEAKRALEVASAKLLFDTEKDSFFNFLQEQSGKEDNSYDEPEQTDADFSSWLCFDSQGSYVKFKHNVEDTTDQIDKPEESPKEDSFSDLQHKILMTSTPKRVFDLSKKRV